ncbi:MAG: cation transporter [Clostridia bacterium]|nr:cation transporter [Clostridia bacterium]
MTKYLLNKISKGRELSDDAVRTKVCTLAGFLGIVCNLLLFLLKIVVGMSMKSIAIISDAFNNLSDTGSSVVTIIGAKLSRKKPDKEHPFGHGRYEYISALIVSFIIILVGFELFKSSVNKVLNPAMINLSPWPLAILCISVPVKFWMYRYNRAMGKAVNSGVVLAAARDNLNDVVATSAVILASLIGNLINFAPLDGVVGTAVSLLIMYSGFGISMDTIGLLLGTTPDAGITEKIRGIISSAAGIVGVHDLIVHDYGPGRVLASVHAEVPDDCDIVEVHEKIDALEHRINDELGIHIVIHMDPISLNCEYTENIKLQVQQIVKKIDVRMNIHDFRMVDGINNINLIFDVEVPAEYAEVDNLKEIIDNELKKIDSRFNAVINIDIIYT